MTISLKEISNVRLKSWFSMIHDERKKPLDHTPNTDIIHRIPTIRFRHNILKNATKCKSDCKKC